jgi:hypothetical protein
MADYDLHQVEGGGSLENTSASTLYDGSGILVASDATISSGFGGGKLVTGSGILKAGVARIRSGGRDINIINSIIAVQDNWHLIVEGNTFVYTPSKDPAKVIQLIGEDTTVILANNVSEGFIPRPSSSSSEGIE